MPDHPQVAAAPRPAQPELRTAQALPQWFVYYRVGPSDLAAVQAAVRQFQLDLAAEWPGLACGLLRRPGEAGGWVTLMETYRLAGPALPSSGPALGVTPAEALAAQVGRGPAALAAWTQGERHVEAFVPCA
jgi:Domain of unknown function (DUF4936)